jgi:hypothetical protein
MLEKGYRFQHIEFDVGVSGDRGAYDRGMGWHQVPIWLSFAVMAAPKNADVKFGYIKGDTFWAAIDKV